MHLASVANLTDVWEAVLHIVLCAEGAVNVGPSAHRQQWLAELRQGGCSTFKRGAANVLDIWGENWVKYVAATAFFMTNPIQKLLIYRPHIM